MLALRLFRHPAGRALLRAWAYLVHGLRFRRVDAPDLDALYRFRHAIYRAEGYLPNEGRADERFSDQYDAVSLNVIALHKGRIVGAARATPWSEVGLPVLAACNVELPPELDIATAAEMGRFMVAPALRGHARLVSIGLSLELRVWLRENPQIRWLVGFMFERVRSAFRPFVPFEPLVERPLEARHEAARALLPGYWARGGVHAVYAPADSLLASVAPIRLPSR